MAKLPSHEDIERKAFEIKFEEEARKGLPAITPEREELSEGGYLKKAQRDLMKSGMGEHIKYLKDSAEEIGHVVIPKREYQGIFHTPRLSRKDIMNLTIYYVKKAKATSKPYSVERFAELFKRDGNGDREHYERKIDQMFKPRTAEPSYVKYHGLPLEELTRIKGVSPKKIESIRKFGYKDVGEVYSDSVSSWGRLASVKGISKETAKNLFRSIDERITIHKRPPNLLRGPSLIGLKGGIPMMLKPKPIKKAKPPKKRRKKPHGRNGATSRRWKPINGKTYTFADDIWRVRRKKR